MGVILGTSAQGNVELNVEKLIDSRLLIQAMSGAGKSWCLRKILEGTHGQVQHLILDVEGTFSTLREKYDYLLVSKDGDIPISVKTAEQLVKKLLETQASAIIDISELKAHDRVQFAKLFLEALMAVPHELWHPVMVILDEIDTFAPEKGDCAAANATIDLFKRGRKRGFCGVGATQRLSDVSKSVAAECTNVLVGRTTLDVDMRRAGYMLGFSNKADTFQLRTLENGEFFGYGPALTNVITKLKIGNVQTVHPSIHSRKKIEIPKASDAIKKVLSHFEDLPQIAEKELRTLEDYKREVHSLKSQLRHDRKDVAVAVQKDEKAMQKMLTDVQKRAENQIQHYESTAQKALADLQKQADVRFQSYQNATRKSSEHAYESLHKVLRVIQQHHLQIFPSIEKTAVLLKEALDTPMTIFPTEESFNMALKVPSLASMPQGPTKENPVKMWQPAPVQNIQATFEEGEDSLTVPQQRIINALQSFALAHIHVVSRTIIAAMAQTTPKSSAFTNNLGALRSKGYLTYGNNGTLCLTEKGEQGLDAAEIIQDSSQLQHHLRSLLTAPQIRIFDALLSAGEEMSREDLAQQAETTPTSSAFTNNLGAMRSLGLLDYVPPNKVKITPLCFLED